MNYHFEMTDAQRDAAYNIYYQSKHEHDSTLIDPLLVQQMMNDDPFWSRIFALEKRACFFAKSPLEFNAFDFNQMEGDWPHAIQITGGWTWCSDFDFGRVQMFRYDDKTDELWIVVSLKKVSVPGYQVWIAKPEVVAYYSPALAKDQRTCKVFREMFEGDYAPTEWSRYYPEDQPEVTVRLT